MKWSCKNVFAIPVLSLLFILGLPFTKANAQYEDTYVSYNDFYQNLAPYGQWIEDAQYGYVWSPNEDGNFRPYYTNGHWVMTDYGNTWISEYTWGWACFHYGRWTYDAYYGWLWIPGTTWGPAWVSWREGDGYYGWAPISPDFNVTGKIDYACPNDWWVFIPPQYIYADNYYHFWYGPRGNSRIIKNTTLVKNLFENNHVTYVTGPNVRQVQNAGHQPVQIYKLLNGRSLTTRVHDNTVKMFRPAEIKPSSVINGERIVPPNAVTAPQPIGKPQSTNGRMTSTPEYKNDIPDTRKTDAVGTHVNEAVKAKPRQRDVTNPYEYDINRPVQQPRPGEYVPQQAPQPQQETKSTTPQIRPVSPSQKPGKQPASQPGAKPAPQPARPAPVQQQAQPVIPPDPIPSAPSPLTAPQQAPRQHARDNRR